MRRSGAIVLAGLLAGLAFNTAPAYGQYALGDGTALDNNMQQGAGRINPRTQRDTYGQYGNAIVTGNVTGMGGFRGEIGYRAPGEFSDRLGSDDLFRFRARSYPVHRVRTADGGLTSGTMEGVGQGTFTESAVVIRPGTGSTVGEVTGDYTAFGPTVTVRQDDLSTISALQSGLYRRAADRVEFRMRPQTMALMPTEDGRLLEVAASPLTGVRMRPQDAEGKVVDFDSGQPEVSDILPSVTPQVESAVTPPIAPGAEGAPTSAADTDEVIERQVIVQTGSGTPMAVPQRVQTLDDHLTHIVASSTAKPGEDVYLDLLRSIHQAIQARKRTPEGRIEPETPGQPEQEAHIDPAFQHLVPSPEESEDEADTDKPAEADEGEAGDEMLTDPDQPLDTESEVAPLDAPTPEQLQAEANQLLSIGGVEGVTDEPEEQTIDEMIDSVIENLDYDLPPLITLTGTSESRVNEAMANAEEHFKAGRYFEAENLYNRALVMEPGNPMALVGRVHAQIGAGLYRTAGVNLRRLFHEHRELIAARYDAKLLPDAKRLESVDEALKELIRRDPRPEPVIVMAYLSYQLDNKSNLAASLKLLSQRMADDTLVVWLRRIWLQRPAEEPDAEPADAAEPTGAAESDAESESDAEK